MPAVQIKWFVLFTLLLAVMPQSVHAQACPGAQNLVFPNLQVGEVRPLVAGHTSTNTRTFTTFKGTPGFGGQVSQGKLGYSLTANGPFADAITIPSITDGVTAAYVKALAPDTSLYMFESVSSGACSYYYGTFAITAAPPPPPPPPPTGTATLVTSWNQIEVDAIEQVSINVSGGPPNFSGTILIAERYRTSSGCCAKVGFTLDGVSFASSRSVPISLNASGNGNTEVIFVKGLAITRDTDSPSAALITTLVNNASGQPVIAAASPLPITVLPATPVVKFSKPDGVLGVGSSDSDYIEIVHGQANLATTITVRSNDPARLQLSTTTNSSPSGQLRFPVTLDATGSGRTPLFFLRGIDSADTGLNSRVSASYVQDGVTYAGTASYRTVNVSLLSIQRYPGASPLDANPAGAGGLRVFPEKQTPTDSSIYDRVKVVARLNKPIAGVGISFSWYDMDDPSSDNLAVDSNGSAGQDNRGDHQYLKFFSDLVTDANGEARLVMKLAKQPGDNLRFSASAVGSTATAQSNVMKTVVSSGIELTVNGRALPVSSTTSTLAPLLATPMLTTWRRLHIERDSMGMVANNFETRTVTGVTLTHVGWVVELGGRALYDQRFEGGRVVLSGGPLGTISVPILVSSAHTVLVQSGVSAAWIGSSVKLYDDDDMNFNDGASMDGDTGEDVPMPDIGWMQDSDDPLRNKFARAFIIPTYDLGRGDGALPFFLNMPKSDSTVSYSSDAEFLSVAKFDNFALRNDPDFWAVYLLGAYQSPIDYDRDPSVGTAYLGITCFCLGSLVFVETVADDAEHRLTSPSAPDYDWVVDPRDTALHEVAHLLHATDNDGGSMGLEYDQFSPVSLNLMRGTVVPQSDEN